MNPSLPDRRRADRRAGINLAELTLPELRRIAVTSALFLVVLALFLWMVRPVLIAAILGIVVAAYLRPVFLRVLGPVRQPAAAAIVTLLGLLLPVLAVLIYSYFEISEVAEYLAANDHVVAAQIDRELQQFPFLQEVDVSRGVRRAVAQASDYGARLPALVGELVKSVSVAAAVFLFTAFYVFTDAPRIIRYIRSKVPARYADLVNNMEDDSRGVLYGAIYSTLLTQGIKSAVILAMNLLFGVPLAVVLAIAAFIIGFFPIVGSWTIYIPVAAWLLIFRDAPLQALSMLGIGFLLNTLFFTMYLRPKIAAERSGVLNFYWMFLGLVTGVYTFGLAGILLGPLLIGLLKASIDTVTAPSSWQEE